MSANNKIIIAIDGHSSCGKGTLARFLASELGYLFIDSGAMYRAVTFFMQQNNIPVHDELKVSNILAQIKIDFILNQESRRNEVLLNGVNIEKKIRTMEVAAAVSDVAKIPAVRRFLVAQQREIGKNKGVVMDGRDIGTVVFPDAELKIFMTATPEIRAKRRFAELTEAGVMTTYEDVLQNLQDRDRIDSSRQDSPLTLTKDYRILDNSGLSFDQQNAIALKWAMDAINANH